LIAIWATYLCGAALFGRREAFIGAGLLALSASLGLEAHIAKTDAMLAGASAVVLYGIATRKAWPTWLGLAFGMLLKGPILLGLAIVALSADAVWNQSADRIKSVLKPLPILTALLVAVPWFVAIGLQTDGAFFAEALGRDFGGKIASTQEAHGGLPGYYLFTTSFMFWPGIVAVPVAALFAWRNRTNRDVRILLAWLVPMWIMLELVPTKLPHYTLVLYPALALLAGAGWVRMADTPKSRKVGLWIGGVIAALLAIVATATLWPEVAAIWLLLIVLGLMALAVSAGLNLLRQRHKTAFMFAALYLATIFGGIIANSPFFDLSPRLVAQLSTETPDGARIVSPDYREPSLVYLTETRTQLLSEELAPGDILVLDVNTAPPPCVAAQSSLTGTHYAKGRETSLTIYRTNDCSADALTRWADVD
jgi:4-amino-4-deoxy-L-arabinose transferase-like glycosyltransferase